MAGAATDCEDVYRVDFSYSFLKGIDSRRPPSSIVIPPKDLDAMAAMERQYWEIKSKNYDVVIFFKKGKFYELYDQDAAMAHREFGLKLVFDTTNRGKMRLAGVPEQTFSEWARLFVFRGYKVGRVEQMKDDEEPSKSARPKVMQRELVEILTPGTLTDPVMISGYGAIFILSLYPISVGRVDAMAVDLSRRVVYHCPCGLQSDGDTSVREENVFSEVSSLLQQLQPREIIFPSDAFDAHVNDANRSFNQRLLKWVEGEGFLVELIRPSDSSFHERPSEEKNTEQAKHFMAQYLRSLKLESAEAILSGAQHYNFHRTGQKVACRFTPLHEKRLSDSSVLSHERREDVGLVLDSTTVSNLELVTNLRDGSERGSLFNLINHCCTNGGRRLFRSWVLRPSASSRVINARQDAVRFIIENRLDEFWGKLEELPESVSSTPNLSLRSSVDIPTQGSTDTERPRLSGLKRGRPTNAFEARFASLLNVDFERNLSRLADLKESSTQVAFVDPLVQYKKHLQLILSTVEAFQEMLDWSRCARRNNAPPLLQELWGNIDAIAPALDSIESCFDHKVAQTTGIIVPSQGTSPAYDEASKRLETIESKLNEALDELRESIFGGAAITFANIGRDSFLIEVPVGAAPRKCPSGFLERSRTSSCVRYTVAALESLAEEHKRATLRKSDALLDVLRSVASHIFDYFPVLYEATASICYFDCLLSLASLHNSGFATSYPLVEENSTGAHILAEQLRHPFLKNDSVPNTVRLDAVHGRILLLTGPNMAGKSTLMRTIAVNVMLAQMGGPIFGSSMQLAPITRIFTRIGARDATHKGQSTLFVELSETAEILRCADPWSLCLVDELGRGTSTHDGYTIAHATLASMKERQPVPPLLLFSTHYHALAQEQHETAESVSPRLVEATRVQLGYMDFTLSDADSSTLQTITFLYRLVPGICTRSYGVEVALLAGIFPGIVNMARAKSLELAKWYERQRDLRTILRFITHDGS